MRPPIPLHIVVGAPGAGVFIERLCAEMPQWAGLLQRKPAVPGPNVRALPAGCPCCTGRVVMQVSLARILRETGAVRAFVELPDAGHFAALARMLSEPPLGKSVKAGRVVRLPEDAMLGPAEFEAMDG